MFILFSIRISISVDDASASIPSSSARAHHLGPNSGRHDLLTGLGSNPPDGCRLGPPLGLPSCSSPLSDCSLGVYLGHQNPGTPIHYSSINTNASQIARRATSALVLFCGVDALPNTFMSEMSHHMED